MKKRVTIYIEGEVWEKAKEVAWGRRESVSRYVESILDGLNKNGLVVKKSEEPAQPNKFDSHKPKAKRKLVEEECRDGLDKAFFDSLHEVEGNKPTESENGEMFISYETPREKYKRLHPNERCLKCGRKFEDCGCEH